MLNIKKFTFGPFSENTYIIYNQGKEAWIIDPGMSHVFEEKKISDFISEYNLTPKFVLNTHAHIDHVLGVDYIKNTYNIPFGIHQKDEIILQMAELSAQKYGLSMQKAPKADFYIEEGKMILGEDEIEIRLAPGHSPGSIVFYYAPANWLLGGDVLFDGSIGRTDLPYGSFEILENSILNQIYSLPQNTIVYSGHGDETTIAKEMATNPFVRKN